MESCPTCSLEEKRENKYNRQLTNTNLASINNNYCQQCKRTNLSDKKCNLRSDEFKNNKKKSGTVMNVKKI